MVDAVAAAAVATAIDTAAVERAVDSVKGASFYTSQGRKCSNCRPFSRGLIGKRMTSRPRAREACGFKSSVRALVVAVGV